MITNQKCKHHGLTQANSFAVPTNGSKQIPPRVIKFQELKEKKHVNDIQQRQTYRKENDCLL